MPTYADRHWGGRAPRLQSYSKVNPLEGDWRALKVDPNFLSIEDYGSQTVLLPNEVGSLDDIRFLMSNNTKVFTGAGARVVGSMIMRVNSRCADQMRPPLQANAYLSVL